MVARIRHEQLHPNVQWRSRVSQGVKGGGSAADSYHVTYGPDLRADETVRRYFFGEVYIDRSEFLTRRAARDCTREAAMKIGVLAFITESSIDTMTFARNVESLGFDSFFLPEHPIIPVVAHKA